MLHGHMRKTRRAPSPGALALAMLMTLLIASCWKAAPTSLPGTGVAWAQSPSPSASASALPGSKVTEVLQHFYATVTSVVEYQQDLEIRRTNPFMAQPFLPPFLEEGRVQPVLVARAVVQRPSHWELNVRWLSKGKELRFSSNDGYALEFNSDKPDFTDLPLTPQPTQAPSPGAEASPGTLPMLLPNVTPGPADKEVYRYHPLTLIWPFAYKPLATSPDPYKLRDDESVLGRMCYCIERNSGDMVMKIWVDQENYSVLQIQYTDPHDGQLITGQYRSFWDLADGTRSYRTLEVTRGANNTPLYSVSTLAEPTILSSSQAATTRISPSSSAGPTSKPPVVVRDYWEPFKSPFTVTLLVVVALLLLALLYFGTRYIMFLLTRPEFSRDIILLEAEDGPVGAFLKEQGYVVTRCSMEVLTEERKHLGKKLGGTVGAVLPRAVVVAPESFGLIKNHLFLLRAYVEEGGRVLVMRQSASCAKELPFQAYFVPYAHDGRLSLTVRHDILRRLNTRDVETRSGKLLPKEMYVEINQRKMDVEFVQALNKATGVRAVLLGLVREGQGEFILCQFELASDLASSKRTMGKAIFLDVIDYTQGVKTETKKRSGEASS